MKTLVALSKWVGLTKPEIYLWDIEWTICWVQDPAFSGD